MRCNSQERDEICKAAKKYKSILFSLMHILWVFESLDKKALCPAKAVLKKPKWFRPLRPHTPSKQQ